MSAYRIRNWEKHFEGSRTKDYNNKTTCQMPTKHGLGYAKMLKQKNGEAMFGAWCALIQVLSRHEKPRQGFVTDNGIPPASKEGDSGSKTGQPYSFEDLELITGFSAKTFEKLFEFTSQTLDWVQVIDSLSPHCHHGEREGEAYCPLNSDSDSDLNSDSNPNNQPKVEFIELMPEELRTDQFIQAWKEWLQHRKETQKKMTPTAAKKQIAKMSRMGVDRSIAAIEHSIAGSYQGLFEPSPNNRTNNQPPPRKQEEPFNWPDFRDTMQGFDGYDQVPEDYKLGWINIPHQWVMEYRKRKSTV